MAVPVDFRTYKPQNSRDDLVRRIEEAPAEHAEAVLAAYDLLEKLHEKGILDLMNGLLSAGDTVVNHVVDVVSSREAVTALRILLIFSNLLSTVDPDKLHRVIADADKEPPSFLALARQASSPDSRRAMATGLGLLNVLGAALSAGSQKKG